MKTKHIPEFLTEGSSLRVITIDPQADARWEAFLERSPASWIYYHPIWLKLLEEVFDYRPVHLACEQVGGQVVGILPLFCQHGLRSGRIFRSVFTGPLADDESIRVALLQAAVEVAHAVSGGQLHLKMLPHTIDNPMDGLVGGPAYETYHLSLPESIELLRLDSSIKRAVNKATRSGVEVRQAQSEGELRAWYELYVQTMRKLVVLPYPYSFFALAWKRLHQRGLLRLLLAEQVQAGKRRLLGGNLLLLYGKTISFDSSGWREEDQSLRINDLLHWRAIQDACAEGLHWYDFGDVSLENQGLARYKRKWGAEGLLVYDYFSPTTSSLNGKNNTREPSGNPARQLVRAAWLHLPTRTLGALANLYYALHLY